MATGVLATLREDGDARLDANLRAGQWISALCVICAALCGDMRIAIAACAIGAVAFTWFTMARRTHGKTRVVVAAATPAFALLIGPVTTVIVARVNPNMAYTQWFTPLISIVVLALSVQRLEPWRPAVYGAVAAALYILGYDASTWDMEASQRVTWALRPTTQIVRAVFFIGAGVSFAMVSRSLRNAVTKAESKARESYLFGKYKLGKPIASGGMASVVHALYCPEGGFERPVAMKRLHSSIAKDKRVVDAFRAEAELGARLLHPNIVAVLDFGRVADTYFIAMEHIHGTDLRAMLGSLQRQRRKLPPVLAGFVAREILAGLAFAHEAARDGQGRHLRVVHRDLSPANVLVTMAGDVKISDFGIACSVYDAAVSNPHRLVGNVAYQSPEQAKNEPFDQRADLFSVGVVLWEMLTCERLFKRENSAATVHAVLDGIVPTTGLGGDWDGLLMGALDRDPRRRYASAREMSAALDEVMKLEGIDVHAEDLAAFMAKGTVPKKPEPERVVVNVPVHVPVAVPAAPAPPPVVVVAAAPAAVPSSPAQVLAAAAPPAAEPRAAPPVPLQQAWPAQPTPATPARAYPAPPAPSAYPQPPPTTPARPMYRPQKAAAAPPATEAEERRPPLHPPVQEPTEREREVPGGGTPGRGRRWRIVEHAEIARAREEMWNLELETDFEPEEDIGAAATSIESRSLPVLKARKRRHQQRR